MLLRILPEKVWLEKNIFGTDTYTCSNGESYTQYTGGRSIFRHNKEFMDSFEKRNTDKLLTTYPIEFIKMWHEHSEDLPDPDKKSVKYRPLPKTVWRRETANGAVFYHTDNGESYSVSTGERFHIRDSVKFIEYLRLEQSHYIVPTNKLTDSFIEMWNKYPKDIPDSSWDNINGSYDATTPVKKESIAEEIL